MAKEKQNILIIDDDQAMLDCIRMSLQTNPEYRAEVCDNPGDALELLQINSYNLVITDIVMPQMSGLDVLVEVAKIDANLPVILMTGEEDTSNMRSAIQLGAFDFLRKPFEIAELLIAVKQALHKNQLLTQNQNYHNHLEIMVEQRTMELYDAKIQLEKHYLNTILAMVNAMEANDIYTRGHSERVTLLSIILGKTLKLDVEDLKLLRIGALLHDLGKIGIYNTLLNKDQALTMDEYEVMKQHPIIGERIIGPIGLPAPVNDIILQHHEWYNGEGYPYGIKGDAISYLARIVAVADSYDAMTSLRPYRQNLDSETALSEIRSNIEQQFDPVYARAFCDNFSNIVGQLNKGPVTQELLFELL